LANVFHEGGRHRDDSKHRYGGDQHGAPTDPISQPPADGRTNTQPYDSKSERRGKRLSTNPPFLSQTWNCKTQYLVIQTIYDHGQSNYQNESFLQRGPILPIQDLPDVNCRRRIVV
jgi:hypothetical protein